MDREAWLAAIHGVAKSRTRLSDLTFTFHFHALEKEMATHSSVLAWRIPGTGEPGGLPSVGSQSRTRLKRLSSSSSSSSIDTCRGMNESPHKYEQYKSKKSESCSVISDSLQPHGLQPARLLCPWNFPGRNTGVGATSYSKGPS